jgi:hypothetical protein
MNNNKNIKKQELFAWDFRFSRRRVCRWLSSGLLRRVGRWLIALMTEAASTCETSVNFYQTTRRNNPEDSHLHSYFHCTKGLIFTVIVWRIILFSNFLPYNYLFRSYCETVNTLIPFSMTTAELRRRFSTLISLYSIWKNISTAAVPS